MAPSVLRSAAAVSLIGLALAACGGTGAGRAAQIPSEAAARAFLVRLIELAAARDLDGYCSVAGSMCDDIAEHSGGVAAIPPDPPVVAGARVIPSERHADGSISAGGQLLVLCGLGSDGTPYRTEMLVSVDFSGRLYAINGVFWSGSHLAVSPTTDSPSGGDGIDCPGL